MDKKVVKRSLFSYVVLFIVILGIFYFMNVLNTKVNDLTYSEFLKHLEENKVTELTITPNSSQSIYSLTGKLEDYNETETFIVSAPYSDETIKQIYEIKYLTDSSNIQYGTPSWIEGINLSNMPTLNNVILTKIHNFKLWIFNEFDTEMIIK